MPGRRRPGIFTFDIVVADDEDPPGMPPPFTRTNTSMGRRPSGSPIRNSGDYTLGSQFETLRSTV